MQAICVIRFGALGDLCLVGWSLSRLASAPGCDGRRVTLVTKQRFGDLARAMRGVDEVIELAEPGRLADLVRLARTVPTDPPPLLIDAHRVLRSRLLTGLLGRAPRARLRKDTTARLKLLRGGAAAPALRASMRERLDDLMQRAGLDLGEAVPPLAHLAPDGERPAVLGLAPGAQWDPKRWPTEHWVALLEQAVAAGIAVRIFLGPREDAWFDASPLASASVDRPGVTIVRGRGLGDIAGELAGCRTLVCNDSGLLHLAEAVGTPVLAFFGPTVRAFGYAPQLAASRLLEREDLDCRPCSRNGKRPCHRGDLACLVRITPDEAWRTLGAMPGWEDA
jgi:heptosyltransferase-2